MFRQILNWRTALAVIAIFIISGTIFYSQYLARKIAKEEKQKVEQWIEAVKFLISSSENADVKLPAMITTQNTSIPIIEANEKDSILQFINLDSTKSANDISYVQRKLKQFKSQNNAVVWVDPFDSTKRNLYYYGDSKLLNEVRYYPIVQLIVVALFIIITLLQN